MRPYVVLVLCADDGALRKADITTAAPTSSQVWEILTQAMRHPMPHSSKPGVPQRLIVSDKTLGAALPAFLAQAPLEIDLREQPQPPQVDGIIRGLEAQMNHGKPDHPALVAVPGISPELLRDFYAAAADFYRAAPWVTLGNHHVLALRHPQEAAERYAIVMGQGGVEYGIAMYPTWENVARTFIDDDDPAQAIPIEGLHSCFFDDATHLAFDDLAAIEQQNFSIAAPRAYPVAIVIEKNLGVHPPVASELAWYAAALRAIPLLVREHLQSNGRGDFVPLEMQLPVPTYAGEILIAVKYPGGAIPLADQPAQVLDWGTSQDENASPGFDRRLMERPMAELARQWGASTEDTALARAQDLMYQAFEETNPGKRLALAHDALALCADCADAYVLLAEEEADNVQRALELYQQGVDAGERALGKKYFEENAGHFWGLLETRPYMRARQGLAAMLWRLNRLGEVETHYREMLRLNPGDNQGIRYMLLDLLLQNNQDDQAARLLEQYREDGSAVWLYTRALLEFRRHGASARANQYVIEAVKQNPHVPDYLTERKRVSNRLPDTIGWGDEREAVAYAADHLNHWRRTAGAVAWLRAQTPPRKKAAPPKLRRRSR